MTPPKPLPWNKSNVHTFLVYLRFTSWSGKSVPVRSSAGWHEGEEDKGADCGPAVWKWRFRCRRWSCIHGTVRRGSFENHLSRWTLRLWLKCNVFNVSEALIPVWSSILFHLDQMNTSDLIPFNKKNTVVFFLGFFSERSQASWHIKRELFKRKSHKCL